MPVSTGVYEGARPGGLDAVRQLRSLKQGQPTKAAEAPLGRPQEPLPRLRRDARLDADPDRYNLLRSFIVAPGTFAAVPVDEVGDMVRMLSLLPLTLLIVFPLAVLVLVAYPAFPEPTAVFLSALVAYGLWTALDRLRERPGQASAARPAEPQPARAGRGVAA
jgi:hypothetical protein